MLKYHPIYVFKHMIKKVNSQKTSIFFQTKRWAGHKLKAWNTIEQYLSVERKGIWTFLKYLYLFSCRIRAPDIFEFHPCCRCTFLPGAQWHMAFPHSAQWHIRRKSGKKLHSLAHSCSNYISHCQFFSQPRWVFGKKVKFLEKELFMLKGTSCNTLKSVPIQLISRRN